MSNKQKTILFGAPINFGFSEVIKNELILLGYNVIDFSTHIDIPFKYKSITDRITNCYKKVIHKDYTYKSKLRDEFYNNELNKLLENVNNADFGLFIRPDWFPLDFIKSIKRKVKNLIGYQWDGIIRYPDVKNYIPLFDKFFVFDANDLSNNKTLPLTNFYFEKPHNHSIDDHKEAYFIGCYDSDRLNKMVDLKDVLNTNGITDNFILCTKQNKEKDIIIKHGLNHIDEHISYRDNITNSSKSSILIDIHMPIHEGLSFRTFEALGYNKKLITTNQSIVEYDFYRPENIFVWDGTNTNKIQDFLNIDCIDIDPVIKQKYRFDNWVKYILGHDKYIPIMLPKRAKDLLYA